MKQNSFNRLAYLIGITIAITIAIQVYWNIQHYQVNKQQLINEVQTSLDNGIEAYFAEIAKTDVMAFVDLSDSGNTFPERAGNILSRIEGNSIDSIFLEFQRDSITMGRRPSGFTQLLDSSSGVTVDSLGNISAVSVFRGQAADSIRDIQGLANKIIISIARDTLDFPKLEGHFQSELNRKNINILYSFTHTTEDSIYQWKEREPGKKLALSTLSKSTYLPNDETLQLRFNNPTLAVLKRSLTGISLSVLLSALIIGSLFFLLHIIQKQKQLAEIKNDLISNITHEFKTPIATVSTAIEGIKNFNSANDPSKTEKYLDISNQQLQKLHQMVEKLLETATLDNDKLLLNKETADLVQLITQLVGKYRMITPEKELLFSTNVSELDFEIDLFHFENAIANLIDNAIKYGGDQIEVNINAVLDGIEISIADNGIPIDSAQREKIFEKFYRVPTGNRHDVKGFGIGLFYSKKIINKHHGELELVPNKNHTIFKVTL
ncbi:MAG: HAMP domain-containing histidine kinase [Flavobacteriaceae bacterium]|nr:HAMP domain-containing histidine kinase [Flavobacteriaceae bacterium]